MQNGPPVQWGTIFLRYTRYLAARLNHSARQEHPEDSDCDDGLLRRGAALVRQELNDLPSHLHHSIILNKMLTHGNLLSSFILCLHKAFKISLNKN